MLDAKICTTSDKLCSFELCMIVCQNSSRHTKSVYDALHDLNYFLDLTTSSWVIFTAGMASIHLMNVSTPTNKYLNPPGALGKIPMMSIPQIAKGHEMSIGQRGLACFIVCF
jgi:hypothetical protein